MVRRLFSVEVGLFLVLWLMLLLVGRSALLRDPGTFWHVVVGERMLQRGHVVRADPFSFTFAGKPWVAHQWLAECGMAAVHRLAGLDGLLLVTASLLAGIYAWLGRRLLRAGFHLLPVGCVLALVLLASSHQFHVRPLVLSIGLLGVVFALLVEIESGRRGLGQLAWLVPLCALWANLHAGVLAGLATAGLAAAGWCLLWVLGRDDSPVRRGRDATALIVLLVLSGLSVLVNPYGGDLPRAWLNTLAVPLPGLIQEHAPLNLTDPLGWATVVLGLGYLVGLAGVFPKMPRITWLLPLIWFVLALGRVRNVPLFAVTAAIAAADMLPHTRWIGWLQRREMFLPPVESSPASGRAGNWLPAILPAALVIAAMVLQAAGVPAPLVGRGWARLDAARWPVPLVPKLQELNRTAPAGTPIFNDLDFGGLLIYYAPRLRVFIDDRCALYGGEFLQAYDHARRRQPSQIDAWQAKYGFRHALVATGSAFDEHLQRAGAWRVLGRTPVATLYAWVGKDL
ncbi:MAG: hypothetical protein JXB62_18770 [Pirellulales bacterium]|nr:hypothetical protein [Pirellulales bacterium]